MSLFDSLGSKLQQKPQAQNPAQMIQQIKSDPAGVLKSMGYNLPAGIDTKNPQAIISGLMQSGQIPVNRYQQALRMLQMRR